MGNGYVLDEEINLSPNLEDNPFADSDIAEGILYMRIGSDDSNKIRFGKGFLEFILQFRKESSFEDAFERFSYTAGTEPGLKDGCRKLFSEMMRHGFLHSTEDHDTEEVNRYLLKAHHNLLKDCERIRAYEKAIRKIARRKEGFSMALDIGSGTGLLSMLAARQPSIKKVVGVEKKDILKMSERLAKHNDIDVRFMKSDSQVMELDRKADLLITETFSDNLFSEGVLRMLKHAKQELVTEDCVFMPARISFCARLIHLERDPVKNLTGIDYSPFYQELEKDFRMIRTEDIFLQLHSFSSKAEDILDVRLDKDIKDSYEGSAELKASRSFNAICFYHDLHLTDGVTLTSLREEPNNWKQIVFHLDRELKKGTVIRIDAKQELDNDKPEITIYGDGKKYSFGKN